MWCDDHDVVLGGGAVVFAGVGVRLLSIWEEIGHGFGMGSNVF